MGWRPRGRQEGSHPSCRSPPPGHRPAQSPQGCGCGRMCRGLVQPMQVSDHRVVSVECSQGALAVLALSQEGHVSVVPGMTGRSAAATPTQPHCYHKKQEATPCRKTEHHQSDAVLRKVGWHLGTGCYSGLNGGPPEVMSTSCPPESENGTSFGSKVFSGIISYGSEDEVILDQGGPKSGTVSF